jgi:GNAT superfamily N-acetyltransferase
MAGYRFCRTDDIPLLVDAFNACSASLAVPFEPLNVDRFKQLARELDLWTSSCMVGVVGDEPVAVMLAAKRETANLILSVVVRSDHQRQGHGRHLLTSLGQKMAILGPPRLVAEVPESAPLARSFLEGCGYRQETWFRDYTWQRGEAMSAEIDPALVTDATFEDLEGAGALAHHRGDCWERAPETLRSRRHELRAKAIVSERRVEAHLLYRGTGSSDREIVALGCAEEQRSAPLAMVLLRALAAEAAGGTLRFSKVGEHELAPRLLEASGFVPGERTLLYASRAVGREERG